LRVSTLLSCIQDLFAMHETFYPKTTSKVWCSVEGECDADGLQNPVAVDEEAKAIVLEKVGMTAGGDQDEGINPLSPPLLHCLNPKP
jgi:hypothetical protein